MFLPGDILLSVICGRRAFGDGGSVSVNFFSSCLNILAYDLEGLKVK